jgi:hypothetical protein
VWRLYKNATDISQVFQSLTSKPPQVIVEIISKYRETYPTWYSRLNLHFFEDRKKCRGSLDKAPNVNESLLSEAVKKAQRLISTRRSVGLRIGEN